MKLALPLKSAAILLVAFPLFVSCGRIDLSRPKHDHAHNSLRQFVVETQISVLEQKSQNASAFLTRVESELSSTNTAARALQSACDVVWINTNLNDWVASVSNGHP